MPAAPPDPREAFGRLTATHLERLLGSATTLTRLVKPAASAKSMVTGLFSYSDGTTAAVVQIDLHLSLLMSGLMLGCPTPPAAKVEMVGHLERDIRDALAEALNVIAALFNQSQPRRTKLTGIMLAPGSLDTEEAGAYRIDFSMSIARAGNGRIALTGPAVEASAVTAAKLEDLSQSGGPEGLMQVCANLISSFVSKEITIEAGAPFQIEAGLRASVGVYTVRGAGKVASVAVCEMGLASMLGAVPLMISASVAQEQARDGKLAGNILDGFHEVLNVLASPFATDKIYLSDLLWIPGTLAQEVRALIPIGKRVPSWKVTIPGYGTGRMAWVFPIAV